MKNSKLSLISDLVFVWWLPAVLLCTRLLSWPFGLRSFKQPLRYCMIETQKSIQGIQGTTKPSYLDTQCGNSCYFTFWLWYSCYFLVRQKVPHYQLKMKGKTYASLINLPHTFTIEAGQTMKQMILWCYIGFLHFFAAQIYILVTNKEAANHLWRAFKNNRTQPYPLSCGWRI